MSFNSQVNAVKVDITILERDNATPWTQPEIEMLAKSLKVGILSNSMIPYVLVFEGKYSYPQLKKIIPNIGFKIELIHSPNSPRIPFSAHFLSLK